MEKIIALYERLSREDENLGESYSISNQKKLLEDYCREKGWTRFRHFSDDGISGTTFERPEFKAMMQLVDDNEISTIIIKDMSRLGRDYLVVGQLRELFRQRGVRLIAINDNHDVLHHFLGAEVSDYTYEVMKLFMMGIISRISCPGIKFEVMLCLVGGQGAGKSTFLRFLAMKDDWFTDDLKKMDDDNVYRKIQAHLIVEFPEMVAILNAKNVEDTKSFMSRQKDTYKTPYDRHPKDHKRQCVFAGSSNSLDFLPMDRSGNRRFLPILCRSAEAEVHILDDEKASREYIDQMWAEAMVIYKSGDFQLKLPKKIEEELREYQKQFMQEDTKKELILDYLEHCQANMVCSRQLYAEALGNDGNPAQWEIREINDIMNNCSDWIAFSNPRHFPEPYRRQKGWEKPDNKENDFQPLTEEQMKQLSFFDE